LNILKRGRKMALIGSKELMRSINEKMILRKIFLTEKIDRASLARETGISAGTVTKIVSELINEGLVMEVGESTSTGGRKPILLCMNPAYGNILGVKIGLGYLQLIIANLTGEIVTKQRIDFGESSEPVKISKLIKQFVDDRNNNHLVGASVAVSGTVDSSNGIVLDSFILRWKNVKFGEMLSKQLKVPVYIMNDVDSFTTTHLWKGKLRKHSNALVITLGTGIGGSLIVNGELYTGNGGAGEVGHMTVYENGNRCNCGSLGCLEAEAGFEALVNKIYKKTKNKTLLEDYRNFQNTEMSEMDFIKLALKEDLKATREVFEEYSMLVGIALKNLINIFAPEYLLIGGEALEFSEHFLEKAINYARKNAFGNLGKRVTFDVDDFGEEAWTLGGVYKVIQEEMFAIKV